MEKLLEMLKYKRPYETATEKEFVQKYIVEPYAEIALLVGPMENIVINVGESETLFSCHTDTVHHKPGMQEVVFWDDLGYAVKEDDECLGADDTTGVWLMLNMIEAGVPGTYVFHRGEERGGIGSSWMLRNNAEWLKRFKRAIAFDRKGETSVITKQRGSRCCSEIFATALAESLGDDWELDATGVFTDTANYVSVIPECTNLSVGYYDQHTKNEQQNVHFAVDLLHKLLVIEWESLPTVREAKVEPPEWTGYSGGYTGYRGQSSLFPHLHQDDDFIDPYEDAYAPPLFTKKDLTVDELFDTYDNMTDEELLKVPADMLRKLCVFDSLFAAVKISDLLTEKDDLTHELYEAERRVEELETKLEKLTAAPKRFGLLSLASRRKH